MTTPKTGAPELVESQADKEETANEAFRRIEAGAAFYTVIDKDLSSPPGSCADGDCYIVAATGSGLWAGRTGEIATAVGANAASGWYFRFAEEGVFAWVQDENLLYYHSVGTSPGTWTAYAAAPGSLSIDQLSDVDTSSSPAPTNGAVLTWNAALSMWVPGVPLDFFSMEVACSDESTALTAGVAKITFRLPCAVVLSEVRASLTVAQTSGGQVTVDLNEAGVSVLSTRMTIDNGTRTSVGSSPAAAISDVNLADNAEMSVDIDNIGDGTAKGLKVMLIGRRA